MNNPSDRFKDGIVFRTCSNCREKYGCWHFGTMDDCKTCVMNCAFRKTKASDEGLQMLEGIYSNTGGLCDKCFRSAMQPSRKHSLDIEIAV